MVRDGSPATAEARQPLDPNQSTPKHRESVYPDQAFTPENDSGVNTEGGATLTTCVG